MSARASQQQLQASPPIFFDDDRRNKLALCFYKLGQESYKSDPSRASQLIPFIVWFVNDINDRTEGTVDYLPLLFQDDTFDLFDKCYYAIKTLAQTNYRPLVIQFLRLIPLEWKQNIQNNYVEIRLPGKEARVRIVRFDLG